MKMVVELARDRQMDPSNKDPRNKYIYFNTWFMAEQWTKDILFNKWYWLYIYEIGALKSIPGDLYA